MVTESEFRLLGPLQSKIMLALWEHGECVAKLIYEDLQKTYKEDIKYTTVVSTLNNLSKAGFLKKKKKSPAYIFQAHVDKKQYQKQLLVEICRSFYANCPKSMIKDIANLI